MHRTEPEDHRQDSLKWNQPEAALTGSISTAVVECTWKVFETQRASGREKRSAAAIKIMLRLKKEIESRGGAVLWPN